MYICVKGESDAVLKEIGVSAMARTKKTPDPKAAASSAVETVKEVAETVAAKVATKKAPAQKKIEEVYLQAGGAEWNISDCKERIIAAYTAQDQKASDIKKLVVYLKPEEGKAYYVINDAENGSIDL